MLLVSIALFSQGFSQDFGSRISVGASVNFSKKLNAGLEMQQRFNITEKSVDKSLAILSLRYDVLKWLRAEVAYRTAIQKNEFAYINDRSLTASNRINASLRFDLTQWLNVDNMPRIHYTAQWQMETFLFQRNQQDLRQRISISHKFKDIPIKPILSIEGFFRTNKYLEVVDDQILKSGRWNEWRYSAGIDWNLSKQHELEFSIMHRNFTTGKTNQWLWNAGYTFHFSLKK